ncbi:FAD-binding domain protein [Ceratobasidium sp. AG-Ba]|nr:FAD-binding domain protein [Ceratobasidium sp. AG-Ba]
MFKFSEVTYHPAPLAADGSVGTVDVGSGLIWDNVYAALQPYNVTVVGGRVTGVGVAGFALGGGYSWLSNQYGLTIDTVVAYELVLPNGTVTTASEAANSDLFWALKGGFNNFGIVTKFTMQAFPQGQVWGGLKTYTQDQLGKVNNATVNFINNVKDPKAGIITTYNFVIGQPGVSLLMFYDGPTPPAGIFDEFQSITSFSSDVSTRSLSSLVQASPANATAGNRGAFNTVSLKTYSPTLLAQVVNQTTIWGQKLLANAANFVSYDVEPFLPSMTSRSKGGAYPHEDYLIPLNLYYAWQGSANDAACIDALAASAQLIYNQAVAEGQDIAGSKQIKYGNYAPAAATQDLESIYGANLPRLKEIKAKYDPTNIMGLAGGFKF